VLLFAVFSGPLGEEPGWRGFALPRLLERYPALTASLILGVVWAAWHLPLLLVDDLTVYGTINAVLAAVVFTWVYQNTGGSVLIHPDAHVAPEQRPLSRQSLRRTGSLPAAMDRCCTVGACRHSDCCGEGRRQFRKRARPGSGHQSDRLIQTPESLA